MDFWFLRIEKQFQSFQTHSHGYWEVTLNLSGSGTLTVDGRDYPFEPGSIFCIRPGVKHSKRSAEGFSDVSILVRDFCFESAKENVLCFQDDAQRSFYTLYQLACSAQADAAQDPLTVQYLRSLLTAMQNLMLRWKDLGQINPEVAQVQKLLYDNATDPDFDLNAAIDHSNYSSSHTRKMFRQQLDCTPTQYLKQIRIQLAKQLLLQASEQLSISEIAERCGYRDPYYFSRVFRSITGVSPSQFYRESQGLDPRHMSSDRPIEEYPFPPQSKRQS